MKSATLYRNPNTLLAYPDSKTQSGFWLSTEPFLAIEADSCEEVGLKVTKALEHSKEDLPDPGRAEFPTLAKKRLKGASVTTESAFMKKSKMIKIEKRKHCYRIIPCRNGGSIGDEKGFHEIEAKSIELNSNANLEVLGTKCIEALDLCE